MSDKKIEITEATKELLIREGKAQELRDPRTIEIAGILRAPFEFLEKKISGTNAAVMGSGLDLSMTEDSTIYNARRSTVLVDTQGGKLTLILNEKDHFSDKIIGVLKEAPEWQEFNINEDDKFMSLNDVIKLIKRNKFKFADAEKHGEFLQNLMTFNARVTTNIQQHRNANGNSLDLMQRTVDENKNAPEFKLNVPIYEGYPKKVFSVQTCLDATSGSIRFYFESVELYELLDSEKEKAIADELAIFQEKFNCSVVRVS